MTYGIIWIIIGLVLFCLEIYAKHKRNKIEEIRAYIHNKNGNKSILDYYLRSINHKSILEEIKNRVNPEDYKDALSNHQLKNLIKQYVDFEKEKMAAFHEGLMAKLNHEGLNIRRGDKGENDEGLFVILENNIYEPYRIIYSGYQDVIEYLNGIGQYRVIVSSDVYKQLLLEGVRGDYEKRGFKIVDGLFTLQDVVMLKKKVNKIINQISELSEDAPEFGIEYFKITVDDEIGKAIKQEFFVKKKAAFISDFLYLVLVTVFAIGVSNVLTLRFGYLGIPIGIGVGGIMGVYFANFIKASFKNSKVYKGLDYFSKKYKYAFDQDVITQIGEELFNYSRVNDYKDQEKEIYSLYSRHINPYIVKKPTLEAVLCYEALKKSEVFELQIRSVVGALHDKLMEICEDISKGQYKYNLVARHELKRRLFGEIILKNRWILHDSLFNKKELKIMTDFYEKKECMKNYPYDLSIDTSKLIKGIAFNLFEEYDASEYKRKELNYGNYIIVAGMVSVMTGVYLIL